GDARRILDAFEAGHRAGATRRPVHHARVQLDFAIFVRQSAIAHGIVVGIVLDDVDARDHRLKRVSALFQHPHREFDATDAAWLAAALRHVAAVRAGDYPRPRLAKGE